MRKIGLLVALFALLASLPAYAENRSAPKGRPVAPNTSLRTSATAPRTGVAPQIMIPCVAMVLCKEGKGQFDFPKFAESIDLTRPIEPVLLECRPSGCTSVAIGMTSHGVWGVGRGVTPEDARAQALAECTSMKLKVHATEPCWPVTVSGKAWIAGIHCERPADARNWGLPAKGKDFLDAVTNAALMVAQDEKHSFTSNDCQLLVAVTADETASMVTEELK